MYRPRGLFPMLRLGWFNEVSGEWLSLCLLSCNSSALIAWFLSWRNFYSLVCVCFVFPLAEQIVPFLTRPSTLIDSLVKSLSQLRGNKEPERQVQPRVHAVHYLYKYFAQRLAPLIRFQMQRVIDCVRVSEETWMSRRARSFLWGSRRKRKRDKYGVFLESSPAATARGDRLLFWSSFFCWHWKRKK